MSAPCDLALEHLAADEAVLRERLVEAVVDRHTWREVECAIESGKKSTA